MDPRPSDAGRTVIAVEPVQSRAGCAGASPLDVQLTFDAFRGWVEERLVRHGTEGTSWTGDAVVAWFPTARQATAAARTLLEELGAFNRELNVVSRPLQVRVGVDSLTAPALARASLHPEDDARDAAIYLRQAARPNEVLISALTYARLGSHTDGFGRVPEAFGATPAYAYPTRSTRSLRRGTVPFLSAVRGGSGRIAAAAAGALVVLLASFLLARLASPQAPPPETTREPPVQLTPGPVEADRQSLPSVPPEAEGTAGGPVAPPTAARPAQGPLSGQASPSPDPGPATALWRSPEAASGLPARLVPSPAERKWLLAIGIDRYAHPSLRASGAAEDAREVARTLAAAAGVPADHVLVLADAEATLQGIRQAVRALQASAASGKDTVYLYLAGVAPSAPSTGADGSSRYAFAPYDADPDRPLETLLYDRDLLAWLGAVRAQEILVVVDTDRAAALGTIAAVDPGRRLALLAGTGAHQETVRFPEGSAFATSLQEGLQGRADRDSDRLITLEELRAWVAADVPQRTRGGQTPTLIAGFGGGPPELVFALPAPQ